MKDISKKYLTYISNRRARSHNKSPGQGQIIMTRCSKDPRQISAKFSSNCCKCKTRIPKGATIYYWPSSGEVFCSSCGDVPFRQFLSSAADEEVYSGSGNPYTY